MLPLFKSHYSIGKSILTLNPPGDSNTDGSDSIFDILIENNLQKLILIEDAPTGFLQARKISSEENIHLIFGLRFSINCDANLESKSTHKIIILARNDNGCKLLNAIYSSIYCDLNGVGNFERLKKFWREEDLVLAIPFYDSFLYQNSFSFSNCMPNFSFCNPVFFIEDNGLPTDFLLKNIVLDFCKDNGFKTELTKSIFYKNREDSDALQTYKCICNRSFARKSSLSKPNLDGFGSREFCFESWLEANHER